jgi:hypothetical protein
VKIQHHTHTLTQTSFRFPIRSIHIIVNLLVLTKEAKYSKEQKEQGQQG